MRMKYKQASDGNAYKVGETAYKVAKWVGLIVCPAVATFIGVVGPVWGMANVDAIVTTVNAAGVFIGAVLGYSAVTAKAGE